MELAYGVGYLGICAAVALVGGLIMWVCDRFSPPSKERDEAIWGVVGVLLVGGLGALMLVTS